MLQIMRVKGTRKNTSVIVFWDLGSSSNFVREEFAIENGFRGVMKKLRVKTLRNVVTDYTVTSYACSMKIRNGKEHTFEAFGMESITGLVSRIGINMIRSLFPNISRNLAKKLTRVGQVDVLIGTQHSSWHPEQAERAKGGGDLWIWRGLFGSCIRGSHPAIDDSTHVSEALFAEVVETYFIQDQPHDEGHNHYLEYCPSRI